MFEIGYSLRAAREKQGIGFPEIELATKIRAKYIRALEEEDFDSLPADTYARGFLRVYADYLGLDGEIYVEEYASRFHNTEWEDDPPVQRPRRPRRTRQGRTVAWLVVLALAGIAVLTALVFGAWRYGGANTNVPALEKHTLVLRGVGRGGYVVVRRDSRSGRILFRGALAPGRVKRFNGIGGSIFYVIPRRPAGVHIAYTGVTVFVR